jgi:hypothetical protein
VHTAEPFATGPNRLEVEIPTAKLKKYKSPGSDQIPAELIQAGGQIFQHSQRVWVPMKLVRLVKMC